MRLIGRSIMEKVENTNSNKNKKLIYPYVEVRGPKNKTLKINIEKKRLIIGRLAGTNDVSLEPDPQKFVTRYMHCTIEEKDDLFWLVDNASKNGTFLKRYNNIRRVHGEVQLKNQDLILILAKIDSKGKPEHWKIKFIDPQATEEAEIIKDEQYIEYDWVQARLYLIIGSKQHEINGISPQEHSLIRYMDQRNKNNNNVPVMCTYEELINAIWDEFSQTHLKNDIIRLIWGLRKKIEPDPQNPRFLQNIKGMGYRLVTNPIAL